MQSKNKQPHVYIEITSREGAMKKNQITFRPTKASEVHSNHEFYSEIGHNWEKRAKKLRVRRWRALNRKMEENARAIN